MATKKPTSVESTVDLCSSDCQPGSSWREAQLSKDSPKKNKDEPIEARLIDC